MHNMSLGAWIGWIALGVAIGALSGFMGVGGGILLTPLLLYLGFKPSVASATSLAFIIPVGIAGLLRSRHDVNVQLASVMAVGAVVGVVLIGRPLVEKFNVNPATYKRVFGVLLLLVALDMVIGFSDRLKERSGQRARAKGDQPE